MTAEASELDRPDTAESPDDPAGRLAELADHAAKLRAKLQDTEAQLADARAERVKTDQLMRKHNGELRDPEKLHRRRAMDREAAASADVERLRAELGRVEDERARLTPVAAPSRKKLTAQRTAAEGAVRDREAALVAAQRAVAAAQSDIEAEADAATAVQTARAAGYLNTSDASREAVEAAEFSLDIARQRAAGAAAAMATLMAQRDKAQSNLDEAQELLAALDAELVALDRADFIVRASDRLTQINGDLEALWREAKLHDSQLAYRLRGAVDRGEFVLDAKTLKFDRSPWQWQMGA